MKTMKSFFMTILIILILSVALVPSAAAAGAVNPETDTGSISIMLKKGGVGIPGLQVQLWRVGTGKVQDGQLMFEPLPLLQSAGLELNGLNSAQNTQTAAMLLEFCDAQGILPTDVLEKTTDASGTVLFEDLPVGVYLVRSSADSSYRAVTPYLLQLPAQNEEGTAWDFDIQGEPKVEAQPGSGGGGGDDPPPDNPPPDNPSPDNPPPGEPFPEIPPLSPDHPDPQLPQTGLLQWPVPLLTAGGLLLIAAGVRKKQKDGCA